MKIKLYHPSNKLFDIVKVKYFGENFYTRNDVIASNVKRSFWYFKQIATEFLLQNCRYSYEIEIDFKKLYDLRIDKYNLIKKYKSIHKMLLYLKKYYLGAIYEQSSNCPIVCIFKDMKPNRIIDRIKVKNV